MVSGSGVLAVMGDSGGGYRWWEKAWSIGSRAKQGEKGDKEMSFNHIHNFF